MSVTIRADRGSTVRDVRVGSEEASRTESIGRVGYESYAAFTNWKTFDDRKMPEWFDLPMRVRAAWEHASREVVGRSRRPLNPWLITLGIWIFVAGALIGKFCK